jgi:hyperosmotically inducible protein
MNKYLKFAALVLITTSISACAAGDSRNLSEKASDATITTEINAKYLRDDLVSAVNVDVDTHRGVVTLIGNVQSEQAKSRAVGIAEATKGVESVDSEYLKVVE